MTYSWGVTPALPPTTNAFQYVWRSPWVRAAAFLLLFYFGFRLLGQVTSVLVVFAVAFLIAHIAHPMLTWLERGRVWIGE